MKFQLVDSLKHVSDDRTRLEASKHVSLAEEYLKDHFPSFPVLPGVMMLEAATQAAAWLLHLRRDFACSMAVLKEAKNVRYGRFVAPGDALHLTIDFLKDTEAGASFKIGGLTGDGGQAITGRLELAYFNLADRGVESPQADAELLAHHRRMWTALTSANPPEPAVVL